MTNRTDVYHLSSHLSNLDVVPLLSGLQRLQVVAGGIVVDQFSPPFGDFLLHIDAFCILMWLLMCLCLLQVFALERLICLCIHLRLLPLSYPDVWELAHVGLHGAHSLV